MCHSTCLTCTNEKADSCTSCEESLYLSNKRCLNECAVGQYKNKQSKNCEKCHSSCQSCFGHSETNCLSCSESESTFYDELTKSCLKNCSQPNFYGNS